MRAIANSSCTRTLLVLAFTTLLAMAGNAQQPEGVDLTTLIQRIKQELIVAQQQEIGHPYYRLTAVSLHVQGLQTHSKDGSIKIFIPFVKKGTTTVTKEQVDLTFDTNIELKGTPQNLQNFDLASAITQFRKEIQAAIGEGGVLKAPKVEFMVTFSIEKSTQGQASFKFHVLEIGGEIKSVSSGEQTLKIVMEPGEPKG